MGMFVFVTKETFKYSVVFVYVLVGYSLTFLVMYYFVCDVSFNNFWRAYLYTNLVLLQGDSLRDYKTFGVKKTGKAQDEKDRGGGEGCTLHILQKGCQT
jgi:hypothetical protein